MTGRPSGSAKCANTRAGKIEIIAYAFIRYLLPIFPFLPRRRRFISGVFKLQQRIINNFT